ncbi:MAG: peptidylprolyl isomerase, partial [Clostridia bacterium]|nr:peptidylprolyl isomerase [Clostridia bacterium]
MKKIIISASAVFVASLILFGALFSIFAPKAVMEYNGVKVDKKMYSFWLSYFKKELMVEYGISGAGDTDAFWQREYKDGVTNGEYFSALADERIKAKLVATYMYDALGESLPDYASEDIKDYLAELIDFVGEGSKKTFNQVAKKYKTSYDAVKRVAVCDYKTELLFNLLYGADGSYMTNEQKDSYYNENYSRVKVIFIKTEDSYLTEEERLAKEKRISDFDKIFEQTLTEERFDSLISVYSDDNASSYYSNGFYLSKNSDYPVKEILESSLSMKVGEQRRVESEYGIHYIIKLPLDEKAYENGDNSDWFTDFEQIGAIETFDKLVKESVKDVKVNEKQKNKISFAEI